MITIDETQKLILETMFTLPEAFTRDQLIETANDQHPMLFELYGVLYVFAACMSLLKKLTDAGVIRTMATGVKGHYQRLCDETLVVEVE